MSFSKVDNNYKNIFMFKNPIRHFLNAENLYYPHVEENINDIKKQSWTKPIIFKIKKDYDIDDVRILKIPNFYNFYILYSQCKNMKYFYDFEKISNFSRIKPSLDTGDFRIYSYQKQLENDLYKLTVYDKIYKFDIKSFYNAVYTHEFIKFTPFCQAPYNNDDRFITSFNSGNTNGVLMGNYISLYLMEFLLFNIMNKIRQQFNENNIYCSICNFSDDIYVFGSIEDEEIIKRIVSSTISEFSLELNNSKYENFDYEKYNSENIITKYWRTIINKQKAHQYNVERRNSLQTKPENIIRYQMNFTNQLIYRVGKLDTKKKKVILIKNFFKSNFFYDYNQEKYYMRNENVHQLLFLFKQAPEILLYCMPKFKNSLLFKSKVIKFLEMSFMRSVKSNKNFHEEQMYFLYALHCMNNKENPTIKEDWFDVIMQTDNQILKSYFVMYYCSNNIDLLKYLDEKEENWFLNYHIILKSCNKENYSEYINKYLMPEKLRNSVNSGTMSNAAVSYSEFYLKNLNSSISLIKDMNSVEHNIHKYLTDIYNEKVKLSEAFIDIDFEF